MKYLYRLLYFSITWFIVGCYNGLVILWHFDLEHLVDYGHCYLTIKTIQEEHPSCYCDLKWFEKPVHWRE